MHIPVRQQPLSPATAVRRCSSRVTRRGLVTLLALVCASLVLAQLLLAGSLAGTTAEPPSSSSLSSSSLPPAPDTPQAVWSAGAGSLQTWEGRHYWPLEFMRRRGARAGQRVLDVGCGLMLIEPKLPAGMVYVPSDVVARDNRTLVADYRAQGLPQPGALPGGAVDWVLVLGVLEYMPDYARFARELRAYNASVVMTYAGVPEGAARPGGPGAQRGRLPYLWMHSLRVSEVWQVMRDAGFEIVLGRARLLSGHNVTTFVAAPRVALPAQRTPA
eukprot:m51a1_g4649 hypothetical protein (273) ;mRNA; r:16333-17474